MTKRHFPVFLIIAGLAGCGGITPAKPGPPTPHGGIVVPLPEDQGFVEILKQAATGKAGRSQVIVYFLDKDRNPMSGAPTTATFQGQASGNKPVAFKPMDGGAGGLVSEPISDRGEIEGELAATIGGSPVTVPIMIR